MTTETENQDWTLRSNTTGASNHHPMDAKMDKKESPIQSELQKVERNKSNLEGLVGRLGEKLQSVLSPSQPQPVDPVDKEQAPNCDLQGYIRSINNSLENTITTLEEIINRIQL